MRIKYAEILELIRRAGFDLDNMDGRTFDRMAAYNRAHATTREIHALEQWATNSSLLGRDPNSPSWNPTSLSMQKVSHRTFLFGGTGQCGNKWPAPIGRLYPVSALIRFGRGRPKLVAFSLSWY